VTEEEHHHNVPFLRRKRARGGAQHARRRRPRLLPLVDKRAGCTTDFTLGRLLGQRIRLGAEGPARFPGTSEAHAKGGLIRSGRSVSS